MKEKMLKTFLKQIHDFFDADELELIQSALLLTIQDYDIQAASKELIVVEENDFEIYRMFLIAKKVEGCTDRTIQYYSSEIKKFLNKTNKPIKEVDTNDIRLYIAQKAMVDHVSATTQNNILRILRSFFGWLTAEEYIKRNPMLKINRIRTEKSMRQLIKYPGSKWSLSDWITGFFPDHHSYLEPFFGSGAVLFNKNPSRIETVNDLDGEVVNLFECIKSDPEQLASLIYMTPYSRDVFEDAYRLGTGDRFERAIKFMIRCDMGHGFRTNGEKVGFKIDIQGREAAYAIRHWNMIPYLVMECVNRLKQVQIENRPAIDVINRFNGENVLIYCDPPYLLGTRHGKQYRCEMEDKDHAELLEALKAHKGPVILSGYESDLYNDMLQDWHKEIHQSRNQRNKIVKETLWMNFEPAAQVRMEL